MHWILIISLTHAGHGVSTTAVEFNSRPACEFAAGETTKKLRDGSIWSPSVRTVCVPKGSEGDAQ